MILPQAEVLERGEGIKREYNELDTVWFMAGSLFKVICVVTLSILENSLLFVSSFLICNISAIPL